MLRGYLVLETGRGVGGAARTAVGEHLLLGRADDCGIVVDDGAASRRHAELRLSGGGYVLRDLGSTNGTLVNGARAFEAPLRHGDRIQIGETVLRFELEECGEAAEEPSTFSGTILEEGGRAVARPSAGKAEELLQAVYSVTNAIATLFDPCPLVDRVLETTVRAIRAQRGAVYFADAATRTLQPCPVCQRVHMIQDGRLESAEIGRLRISNTVARRVLEGRESVLFQDTDANDEFQAADSIVALKLRSIICVPLRGKGGVLGILYIDTDRARHAYTHEDMLLATAVGKSAGLAIENAQLHQQLLEKQRIEQEIRHAWTIQEGFLMKEWPAGDPRFEVYGETRPAKVVGGGFYGFVQPGPDRAGALVGDVSGKGVPAALAMAQLLAGFRVLARQEPSPAAVVRSLNADLTPRSRQGLFCTLCYLTLDLKTGRGLCANAGHHPPVAIGPRGIASFGEPSGPPVGVLMDGPWVDTEFALAAGDTLLLYTDGVVEAGAPGTGPAPRGEYGFENLYRVLERLRGEGPRNLVEAVNEDVAAYCAPAPPHDDCTLLALRYLGQQAGH